jgi:hypothetical protein
VPLQYRSTEEAKLIVPALVPEQEDTVELVVSTQDVPLHHITLLLPEIHRSIPALPVGEAHCALDSEGAKIHAKTKMVLMIISIYP